MFLGLIFTPEAGALIPQMCEVSCNKVSKKPASRQPDLQIDLRPAITAFMEAAGLPTPLSASFMPSQKVILSWADRVQISELGSRALDACPARCSRSCHVVMLFAQIPV